MKMRNPILTLCLTASLTACSNNKANLPAERWTEEKVNEWYAAKEWPVGCNYVPSYAGNQLQMWQNSTWDPETIDRELGWAEELGFNSVRIFLHHKLWLEQKDDFYSHVDRFLEIADSHGISCLMTIFTNGGSEDRCIDEDIKPIPGIHNSIWAQTPGITIVNNPDLWGPIEQYEKDLLTRYKDDKRIIAWCVYNEPENVEAVNTLPLLKKAFQWAREVNPSQPLTATVITDPFVARLKHMHRFPTITFCCENSDVISYHCYDPTEQTELFIRLLSGYDRPLFCTEYLGRQRNCTFENTLPVLKENKVAAYNFGLTHGATQCQYEWNQVVNGEKIPFTEEPELWFHDILHEDGTPWNPVEVEFIKECIKE